MPPTAALRIWAFQQVAIHEVAFRVWTLCNCSSHTMLLHPRCLHRMCPIVRRQFHLVTEVAIAATVSRDAASKLLEGVTERHSKARAQLRQQHWDSFAAWLFELEAGFNLCFYGFGSKRSLLRVSAWMIMCNHRHVRELHVVYGVIFCDCGAFVRCRSSRTAA
jgi:Origin recognition complex subunit 2